MIESFVTSSLMYELQLHQEGQSPYAYKFAEEEIHWFGNESYFTLTLMYQIDTVNMNLHRYTCNESNQNNFMHCVESYYAKRLGCLLPWSVKDGQNNPSGNVCKGKDKFREYKNISMNILRTEEQKELMKEGCFIPNCQQRSWNIKKEKFNEIPGSGFEFFMPPKLKVLQRREMKLYTPINFFAEVGGYLGLLLGESLIAYIIMISKWIHVIGKKLKDKCRKDAEEPN